MGVPLSFSLRLSAVTRMASVRAIRPDAVFYTGGARLLHGGDPYDVIGHIIDADYLGCAYQSHLVRRWAGAARDRRKVYMFDYVSRTVRYSLESLLQGARMIGDYRFNYIGLAKSEDQREREGRFIERFVQWGGTRPARPPIAFLVSRASEAWWPMDCKTNLLTAGQADRAWAVSETLYAFLLKNGYPFDVFYLDQAADLDALKAYRLVVAPFAYSMPAAALEPMMKAYEAGANFLIAERQGEVDEVGRPHPAPLLAGLIARDAGGGRVRFLEEDLPALEHDRAFVPRLSAVVDALLGPHKELLLERYGNRIEAFDAAVKPDERYLSFINWEDRESRFETGVKLPEGRYRVLTLSSARPDAFRSGVLEGRTEFAAGELARFALKLLGDEVVSLYIVPAEGNRGKPPP